MTFIEAFEEAKACLAYEKADAIDGHLAIQVTLSDDDAAGIFYMEVNDRVLHAEPYDYVDRDVALTVNIKDFKKIFTGRLGFDKAVEEGRMTVSGGSEKIEAVKLLIPKITRARHSALELPAVPSSDETKTKTVLKRKATAKKGKK